MKNNRPADRETNANLFRIFAFLVLLVFASFPLEASSPWTKTDSLLEFAVCEPLLLADWRQTLEITKQAPCRYEHNLILGRHPSMAADNRYFAGVLILHPVVAYLLPETARHYFQGGTVALELGCVSHNYQIGIRFSF